MSELDGFEVVPYIDQRTNKGKIAARDRRIERLEGELGGTRTIGIPSLAFNYVDNRLESIGTGGELYYSEHVIRGVPAELDAIEDKSRWHELFGTPERAARTLAKAYGECSEKFPCSECPLDPIIGSNVYEPEILGWLRGDA